MKLIADWRQVLLRAWSIRLILLTALLSGLEVAVSLLDADVLGMQPGTFALLAGIVSLAATVARLVNQASLSGFLSDEDGAVRLPSSKAGKAGAGAGLAAALAIAVATIGPWEGRELQAYRDIVGVPTICYGETRGVRMGDTATPAECQTMLARGVAQFEVAIRACLPAALPDQTRAAFISAAYNIGSGAFCGSSMSRRALAGDLPGACEALLLWNKAGGRVVKGLTNRRQAERALCRAGLGLPT